MTRSFSAMDRTNASSEVPHRLWIIWARSVPTRPGTQMAASHIFKVVFVNQGKVYEIYARKVSHGSLFGFIEVEELVFGERSAVVVDPSGEKVKAECEGVKRT